MRKQALHSVVEMASFDDRVCFIGSDLGFGVMDDFKEKYPDRIFREGISEQHIIGMAAGLAMDGKVVYINTIASFLTRRCLEQIVLDLCLAKARVHLIGSGGGLVYAPLGPTHLATDDLALMRALPDMTILAPCDAPEISRLMPQTLALNGPSYIRLARGGDQVVSAATKPCVIGRASPMLDTEGPLDVLFISCGILTQTALEAASELKGMTVEVLHNHSVKPLDRVTILSYSKRAKRIYSLEEHILTGGLGSAVAEILAENPLPGTSFRRLALPDSFFSEHGSQADIMAAHGLSAAALVKTVADDGKR